jgi:hypothetical protein
MWLFTPDGFFSAVEHKDDPNKIMIRTRARLHAQRLVDACPENDKPALVETPPPADYRYRVTVKRETWCYLVAHFAAGIDYLNFKNEASKRKQPVGFMSALHAMWSKLLGFQDSMHDDTKKGRWGSYSTHWSHDGGDDSDPFGDLDDWLGRSASGTAGSGTASAGDVEYVDLAEGMIVQMADDPDMGEGEVVSIDSERWTALVHFITPLEDGDVEEDVIKVPIGDLVVLYDPIADEVEERMEDAPPLSTRPEIESYDTIEELVEADDGSWPSPELRGFMKGA